MEPGLGFRNPLNPRPGSLHNQSCLAMLAQSTEYRSSLTTPTFYSTSNYLLCLLFLEGLYEKLAYMVKQTSFSLNNSW